MNANSRLVIGFDRERWGCSGMLQPHPLAHLRMVQMQTPGGRQELKLATPVAAGSATTAN